MRLYDIRISDKRALRICRNRDIKSTIKYARQGCTRNAANPQYLAENVLNREFHANKPNEKWLTDVTEFKWYENGEKRKVYLSAILDLYDRRIVSYAIRNSNDNSLVYDTFDAAVAANPDAHPLFHSDRGYQYTNRTFHTKLKTAGMTQSMSRVAHCIDNGPMEGFWGILKRERYYGRKFTDRESLVQMLEDYISYYNTNACSVISVFSRQWKSTSSSIWRHKNDQLRRTGRITLYYFTVLLTGCGSSIPARRGLFQSSRADG